jgi:hypothetical protein
MSPSMAVDYHYKLGTGLARFGQQMRARGALHTGLELAERYQLNAWYFKIEQALAALTERGEQLAVRPVSKLSEAPAVREMEVGLREYAMSSA